MSDFTKLKEGLPAGTWHVDIPWTQVFAGDELLASCGSQPLARAIAAIPEMLEEIERLRSEVAYLQAEDVSRRNPYGDDTGF